MSFLSGFIILIDIKIKLNRISQYLPKMTWAKLTRFVEGKTVQIKNLISKLKVAPIKVCNNKIKKKKSILKSMSNNYKRFLVNELIPGQPTVNYDSFKKTLVHVYENIPLETSNFQNEINSFLKRKESFSGNVVVINKIKDEQITYRGGVAAMEISVVTDYVPWRMHIDPNKLSYEQALFILDGACRGFRELLHRVKLPFIIQSYMIGVDEKGNVKVWWNDLFYKGNFGFEMIPNVKLEEMVRSLVQTVLAKMERQSQRTRLQNKTLYGEMTFISLEGRIKQLTNKINLKQVGLNLLLNQKDFMLIQQHCKSLDILKPNAMMNQSLRLSVGSRKSHISAERLILSPRQQKILQFNPKIITKRTYKDGTSPNDNDKLRVIKNDIEKLRDAVNSPSSPMTPQLSSRLRSSKSVQSLFSYQKGLFGNTNIPQINNLIKESEIIGSHEDLMVSRFVEPVNQSIYDNSEHYNALGVKKIESQVQINSQEPICISRLQHAIGQEKSINSTSRSINQSRLRTSGSNIKIRFGESNKKQSEGPYVNSFLEK